MLALYHRKMRDAPESKPSRLLDRLNDQARPHRPADQAHARSPGAMDPALARVNAESAGIFCSRTRDGGYMGLLEIFVAQQVSTAAANAGIWSRFVAGVGELHARTFWPAPRTSCAASACPQPKVRYSAPSPGGRGRGRIDFAGLETSTTTFRWRLPGPDRGRALDGGDLPDVPRANARLLPEADIALRRAIRWADGSGNPARRGSESQRTVRHGRPVRAAPLTCCGAGTGR